jgi:hypothetical protein
LRQGETARKREEPRSRRSVSGHEGEQGHVENVREIASCRCGAEEAGVTRIGTVPGTLITTGASLALTRGRRPIGLALAMAGGLLLWWEIERERAATLEEGRP